MIRSNAIRPATLVAALALALAQVGCGVPPEEPVEEPAAADVADDEDDSEAMASKGDPAEGKEHFRICAGCHGPDGEGIPSLGKNLHSNAFLADLSDDEAVEFLKVGRLATDPLNTTGVAMPPKGGNPALTDEDLYDIVAYVRTLE